MDLYISPNRKIILAGPEHIEQIADLHLRTWQEAYKGMVSQDYIDALTMEGICAKWSDYIKQPEHGVFLCVEVNPETGEMVRVEGSVGFKPYQRVENCIYVYSLYVEKDLRGQGIGTHLVNAIAARGKKEGYPRMGVCVMCANEGARRLYARMGAEHCMFIDDGFAGDPVKSEVMLWDLAVYPDEL